MAVDNIIQYNGRNSFRVTDIVWSYPYGVQSADHVTHSFQAYCDVWQSSGVRAKTKFIDANGDRISEVTHTFEVPTVFDLVEITVPVPVGAVMAMLAFMQGGRDWWVAEPKSEFGESATPYNVNYQGQLTFITPTGVYTGMITTGQIVVSGSVSNPDEKLDEWITTIKGGMINLSSTVTNKTTHIDTEGVYTGKVVADQIQTGKVEATNKTSWFDLDLPEIVQTGVVAGREVRVEMSPTQPFKLSMKRNGVWQDHIYITDNSGFSGPGRLVTSVYDVNEDGRVDEQDMNIIFRYVLRRDISPGVPWPSGYPKLARMDVNADGRVSSSDINEIYQVVKGSEGLMDAGGNRMGVDSGGVWAQKDQGAKVYIHTF